MKPASVTPVTRFSEDAARRVLLVQAFETGADDDPQWSAEDRAWATRLARESGGAQASAEHFLQERAHHALQRLGPRDAGVRQTLQARGWRSGWMVLALLVGLLVGLAIDAIGGSQRINLLAPPVWGVVAWNLLVYALLLWPMPKPLQAWFAARLSGLPGLAGAGSAAARFRAAWLHRAAPLLSARAALLLHVSAAALALGLIGGLYVRGLVLDYRAGWQSTFLDATQVHAALATLLAPAVALTGIALPDATVLQTLQVGAEAAPTASAAPWIHLYAATLVIFVVLPRLLLAAWAAARAGLLSHRLPLPLDGLYFQRLLRERGSHAASVQVLPHGAAVGAHALACLKTVLTPALGSGLRLSAELFTAYGNEEGAAALHAPPDTALRLALVDLSATPEDDSHGAFVRALRRAAPGVPLLVLADETALRARFATLPARLAERRATWQQWARAEGVGLICVDLAQPDTARAERELQAALHV